MNNFYHSFSIGFNFWFILLPIQVAIMVAFGISNVRMNEMTGKVQSRDQLGTVTSALSIVMTIITLIVIACESSRGIIQFLDNQLAPGDDPLWSIVFYVLTIGTLAILLFYLFGEAETIGRKIKRQIIKRKR